MAERSFPEGWPEASGGMSALRVQLLFLVAIVLSACASSTDPEGAEYSYFLELPDGPGPHPAVLFMPACSGDVVAREVLESNHARHLREKGFATIMFDPVSRRGIRDGEREICQDMSKAWSHYYKRVGDIKHFVENELPGITEVDQERLGLFGQSGGGISSFHYANAFIREASDLPDAFSAIVAEQTACHSYTDRGVGHWDKPLLLIAPEKDALNPYEGCLKLAEQSETTEVLVLKGASHAYDWPYPARTVFVVGRNVRMWPSHRAKEEARAATIDFFGEHLLD